ncbi:hypothetical protein FA95DRAFT_103024 [Auriscalpium vulgare]|uniref:Uncharacterized protein n=1 Tax=Auriscalpium vulgare TaxID=40419 RepID=A0ACB8RNV4_9AGAM|nr:hypothetical protein FA95DRAFT_103024 [Auriscalpium vulgare]
MASDIISKALSKIHADNTIFLSFNHCNDSTFVWTHTFSCLSYICLPIEARNFIAALNEDISHVAGGAGPRSFLFTNLRRIGVLKIDFRVVFRRAGDDYVVPHVPGSSRRLLELEQQS